MGIVYLVEDILKDNALFALKVIRKEILKKSEILSLTRFKNEYDIMTRLKHPNLVQVYDFGTDRGNNYYILMEFIEGVLLSDLIKRDDKLPLSELFDLIVDVLRALEFIHSRNIIYRDIKPENIMRTKSCTKLMDFGISDTKADREKKIRGTIMYMAPEVLMGDLDFQLDIYSLGIVFYELITKSRFFGKDKTKIDEIIHILKNRNDFECFFSRRLGLLEDNNLFHLIKKMTSYYKKDRYYSCSEIISDINKYFNKSYSYETKDTMESYLLGGVFVNRKDELRFLEQRLADNGSKNKLLIVSGSMGIGKTSLFKEFRKYCRLNNINYFDSYCTEGELNQYHTVGELINQAIQISPTDLVKKYGSHLKAVQRDNPNLREYRLLKISNPKILKDLIIENLSSFFLEFARTCMRKTVLHINDLEWIDHGSFEIIQRLIFKIGLEHNKEIPIFISANINENRLEADNPVCDLLNSETSDKIVLKPFRMEHVKEFVEKVFGIRFIDESIRNSVSELNERVGGNPLFLGELLKSLLNSGLIIKDSKNWKLLDKIGDINIPNSLVDIVKLRTKSLLKDDFNRYVLQVLSLLRIEIDYDNLSSIMKSVFGKEIDLAGLLLDLERREIIQSDSIGNKLFYKFNSRLTKDIIKSRVKDKKEMNIMLAGELERLSAESRKDLYNEEIAYHYQEAKMGKEAIPYLLKSAEKARSEYFNQKAVLFLENALDITDEQETDSRLDIMFSIISSLDILGRWQEAIKMLTDCIDLSKKHNRILMQAEAYNLYGGFELKQGNYEIAHEMHEKALTIFKDKKYERGMGKSYFNLATIYFLKGDFKSAIDYYQRELEISRILNDEEGVHRTLFNLTVVYYHLGEYDKALEYLERNIEQDKKNNNKIELLKCYNNIGNVYFQKGNTTKALKYYKMCHGLAVKIGYLENRGIVTGNIGLIYEEKGNYDRALKCYYEKLQISQSLGYKRGISIAYGNIGNIHRAKGDLEKALEYYNRDLIISEELEDKRGMGHSYGNIAGIYKEKYDYVLAEKYFNLQKKIADELADKQLITNYCINHANIMMQRGFFNEAENLIDKLSKIAGEIGNKQMNAISNYARGNLAILGKKYYKAIACFRKAEQIFYNNSYKYYLCLTHAKISEAFIELNKKDNSEKELKKALLISRKLGLKPLKYITELLQNRFTAFDDKIKAHDNLQKMLGIYRDEKYTAEINYFAFLFTNDISAGKKAQKLYLKLYETSGDIIIKERLGRLKQNI